jgi:hypothetical protein
MSITNKTRIRDGLLTHPDPSTIFDRKDADADADADVDARWLRARPGPLPCNFFLSCFFLLLSSGVSEFSLVRIPPMCDMKLRLHFLVMGVSKRSFATRFLLTYSD